MGHTGGWLQGEIINIVTGLEEVVFIRYSTPVHMVLHVSAVWRWLTNLCGLWLVKTMIDFSGCDRWKPSLLMVQNGVPSVLITTHWLEKKVYLLDCRRHLFDSQVMELSFFLFQIKIIPPSSFLPSIFCHIKRVINLARWRHHYWNNLTVFFLLLLQTESANGLYDTKTNPLTCFNQRFFFWFMVSSPCFPWKFEF